MEAKAASPPEIAPDVVDVRERSLPAAGRSGKDALRRRLLATADLGAACAGVVAVAVATGNEATAVWAGAMLPVWVLVAKLHGLYDADHRHLRHLTVEELMPLFMWATVSTAVTALVLGVTDVESLSATAALAMWASALGSAFVLRGVARAAWRRLVSPERTIVLGDGPLARSLARKLALERGHHVEIVQGRFRADADGGDYLLAGLPWGGGEATTLSDAIRRHQVERVVVAREDLDESHLREITGLCRAHRIKLSVAPPLPAMLGTAVTLTHLAELPLIEFKTWDPSRSTLLLKRLLDVGGAVLATAAVAPLMLVVAVAIRLDSRGPALFRQQRAGLDGHPFTMLKFRTMVEDAEARLGEVIDMDALEEPMFKMRADPRVTRLGRLLRRTSLDELPQLLNVIRGDMSLVGPRPEETRLTDRYTEEERFRIQTRPGLTGPMQVHGRGELTFEERLAVEREYVENYALRKDLVILLKTAGAVVRRTGAY